MTRVVLRKGRARPLWARNPWVYAGSIERVEGEPEAGDVVEAVDHRGKFIARGFWNGASSARVAALTWDEDESVDEAFVRRRITDAQDLRRDVLRLPDAETDAYRLVHGAGDGLPGLVADVYGEFVVVRIGSPGLERLRDAIGRAILEETGARGVWAAREPSLRAPEGATGDAVGCVAGDEPPERLVFREIGIRYAADLREGPKTGHFLDQRETRRLLAGVTAGRRVLDAFCATGGFALAAALGGDRGGATSVRAVDESSAALTLAEENARLNDATGIDFVRADVFEDLRALETAGERFGAIVLDPPAFARTRRERDRALRGYKEINLRALGLLEPGGLLLTCSCSSPIDEADLEVVLREAAMDRGVDLRILDRRGQGPDHPVPAAAPESRYLTALLARRT